MHPGAPDERLMSAFSCLPCSANLTIDKSLRTLPLSIYFVKEPLHLSEEAEVLNRSPGVQNALATESASRSLSGRRWPPTQARHEGAPVGDALQRGYQTFLSCQQLPELPGSQTLMHAWALALEEGMATHSSILA